MEKEYNLCPKCKAVNSYEKKTGKFLGDYYECQECSNNIISEYWEEEYIIWNKANFKASNPRCPNPKCTLHKDPLPAKHGFVISVVEEGFLGKIFKSEAYGIVSCKKCGEIIGVGGKG